MYLHIYDIGPLHVGRTYVAQLLRYEISDICMWIGHMHLHIYDLPAYLQYRTCVGVGHLHMLMFEIHAQVRDPC